MKRVIHRDNRPERLIAIVEGDVALEVLARGRP
jgi:hypothetical protein